MSIIHADILKTAHPDLVAVIKLAATMLPFNIQIVQAARTAKQHARNVKTGATQTSRSRHVVSNNASRKACAVDMGPLLGRSIPWHRLDLFRRINTAMMVAARQLKIDVEWGGDWKTFQDLNHWQLSWKRYP